MTELQQVFINGRFLQQRVTGVQRFAGEILRALDEVAGTVQAPHFELTLLHPKGVTPPQLRHIHTKAVGRFNGHLWEQWDLARHLSKQALLINLGFTGPASHRRQMITVHDGALLRMPQTYTRSYRTWVKSLVRWNAGRAPVVLSVSNFSATEARDCFGIDPAKIRVVSEGWQHIQRIASDDSVLERHGLRDKPYALAVSSMTENKNFKLIAQALETLGDAAPTCVVVGGTDPRVFRSNANDTTAFQYLGYVSDAELKALYEHARCFVFPSHYEGFGLPALEAMALGCPVLASTAPAVQETCDSAALYFDPNDARQLAEHLTAVFHNKALADDLSSRARQRAHHYSWQRGAHTVLAAIGHSLTTA